MASEIVVAQPKATVVSPAIVYFASLDAMLSKRTMAQSLTVVAQILRRGPADPTRFPWWDLRYESVQAVRASLAKRYSAATTNRHLVALRGVLRQCWKMRLMSHDDYMRAIDVKGVKHGPSTRGRALSKDEIASLFEVAKNESRMLAILALGYAAGLRSNEIVTVELSGWAPQSREITVLGKGNKPGVVPVATRYAHYIDEWIKERGTEPGPLICHDDKRPLTNQGIRGLLQKYAYLAKVAKFSPHDLRRTLATHLLESGIDLNTVSKILRHESIMTTVRYDKRQNEVNRQAMEKL